jgi:hypothetical protein
MENPGQIRVEINSHQTVLCGRTHSKHHIIASDDLSSRGCEVN